ncbi:MAG: hypothetical protein J6J35_03995 [Alphaproteobacteria bacterium]|nr:hypothetical protein [Alphaproteobacteria bacterium]MBP3687510.1 hypothetical protein [Alphaproteobacteria bacterium]
MKSVIITIIMFAGLYVIINSDVLGFLGQKSVLYFSIGAALCMLLTAVIVLGIPHKKKGGQNDKKDLPK